MPRCYCGQMLGSSQEDEATQSLYSVESSDPQSQLVDRSKLSDDDVAQINQMMAAMAQLRRAEDALSEASTRYMKLNKTDMRALHYLIVCLHRDQIAMPGDLAIHLGITTASTTKLLDRLAKGGHIIFESRTRPTGERSAFASHQGHIDPLWTLSAVNRRNDSQPLHSVLAKSER